MEIEYSEEKNIWLKETRGVNFEDIKKAIEENKIVANVKNPNEKKYSHQSILVVKINNYAYAVPYVIKEDKKIFLKTVFASRKYNKLFNKQNEKN